MVHPSGFGSLRLRFKFGRPHHLFFLKELFPLRGNGAGLEGASPAAAGPGRGFRQNLLLSLWDLAVV